MICKAERIDGEGEVEGYYVYTLMLKQHDIHDHLNRVYEINPQTLKYSFDGVSWYSEEQIQNALELIKDFDFKETSCELGYLPNFRK